MEDTGTRRSGDSQRCLLYGVPPSSPMLVPLLEEQGATRTPAGPATATYSVPVAVSMTPGRIERKLGHEQTAHGPSAWDCLDLTLLSVLLFAVAYVGVLHAGSAASYQPPSIPVQDEHRPKSFYDTDGHTGYSYDIVPDIVHFVSPCGFTGNYSRLLEGINFTFISTAFPKEIFNISIQERYHATDVVRLRALLQYGGIYVDSDVFVVQSLRRYLRYEATISCGPGVNMGNMLMIFHKNSRFLRLYLNTYRQLNDSIWYYNAGVLPTVTLIEPHAHLINRERYGLETQMYMLGALYEPHAYPYWRNIRAVHLLAFHRGEAPLDPLQNAELNETNIRDLDNVMGQMARSVIFGTSDFVPPDAPVLSVAELAARKDRGEDLTKMRPENARSFFEPVLNKAK
ncbi:hypothetical protein HPB51_004855 [Rhipicephalus microplus]|uniref:Alpha-1,4-N-acetylglucosaminyltransferase n=1 Tax=Rhipicephalus microplus TaxID=6941 RepID=A0A9J6E673_RHIMP|nr:hypothetical protein HPB51_004855 [Rhipicephalus microplus]